MKNVNGEPEFMCMECHTFCLVKDKGKATMDGKPYDACKQCCEEEQKKQFYSEM